MYIADVNEEFQRKGLSTLMYDYIEKDLNIILEPDSSQLEPGKLFWKNRRK